MTPFRFRLQPLLDARERDERASYAALLAAASMHARDRERAGELRLERSRIGHALGAASLAPEPTGVREALTQLDLLAAAIERQDSMVRHSCKREEEARATFADARREHRRLATLRDRAHAAYAQAAEQREARALDEANAAHHNFATPFARSFHN